MHQEPRPPSRRRSWWGWGWADAAVSPDTVAALAPLVAQQLGHDVEVRGAVDLDSIDLPAARIQAPAALAAIASDDREDRAGHAYGKSFRDVVRGFHGELDSPPDLVLFPDDEAQLAATLDWCADAGVAAVLYGAGSSVVGGVETGGEWAESFAGVVSVDLSRMDRVHEVDRTSRAARIGGGITGPALEDHLRPLGLTLRHFPQSFEFSTLGGWIATRSGGHFATGRTHIDDFVEAVRVLTPQGPIESRRLPGSGAGPSPDRLFIGSEGILGAVTEAWMRLQDRPVFKAGASVHFESMVQGVTACRALGQSGLEPTNCRLLDPEEAAANAGGSGEAILVLGFESAHHPVDADIDEAVDVCRDLGGTIPGGMRHSRREPTVSDATDRSGEDAADAWRSAFLKAPYLRDAMVALGCIAETFETAITWDRFEELDHAVRSATLAALQEVCGGGTITCRFTHVYPDGVAPYYTVLAPSRHGEQVAMWDDVKTAAAEAILAAGGTITHHHAVGRDHRPQYDRQRPDLFADALSAAKSTLDPAGILNPGVLVDPI